MLWEKKVHKNGDLKRLMEGTGFSPGMERKAHSADSGMKVEGETLYIIDNDDQEAKLIKGSEPYLDTAMQVTAIGVSNRKLQHEPMPLYDSTFAEALIFADLLFIRQVDDAGEEDCRYLKGLLYRRAMKGRPTVVDGLAQLESAAAFFENVVPIES